MGGAGRLFLLAGIALTVSSGFASAKAASPLLAIVALIAGVTTLTIGEMCTLGGRVRILTALAPPHLRGRYLTLLCMGHALQQTVDPVLVTVAVVRGGRAGWLARVRRRLPRTGRSSQPRGAQSR